MESKFKKICRKASFLVIILYSMWMGSSIQLYSTTMSQVSLPKGVTIWHKLLAFVYFFELNEYKGTISELLGKVFLGTSFIVLVLFATYIMKEIFKITKQKQNNEI